MLTAIEVKTFDFWLFGGLRNFQAGSDTFREPRFPPDIMKFFHLTDLEEHQPVGVLLKRGRNIFFPVPADILQPRKGERGNLKISHLKEREEILAQLCDKEFLTDLGEEHLLPFVGEDKDKKKYEGAGGFISFERLKTYFSEGRIEASTDDLKGLDYFVSSEIKVGLTLDFQRFSAMESMLYTTFVNRPQTLDSSLVVIFKGPNALEEGIYYVGGETRVSEVKPLKEENITPFLQEGIEVKEGDLYRFYLLSHTYIEGELTVGKTLKVGGIEFKTVWVFSRGKEWISGFRKPAIQMLTPATVLVLKAMGNGNLKRLTYVESKACLPVFKSRTSRRVEDREVELHRYGWNHGILTPYVGG
jgi:CRISPR-associated protein Cmr3